MSKLITLLIVLCLNQVYGQTFTGEASLQKVEEDGFYKLFISPEVSVHLNNRFTDIRIFDEQNHEVPFLFQEEPVVNSTREFRAYTILEKKQVKGCCTSLVLQNSDRYSINNINLVIRNADVVKKATLLGSDDLEQWYALKQHFVFTAINNMDKTSEVRIVDFPLSNYNYYSLHIDDSTSAPLNIIKAGYYEISTSRGTYTEVPVRRITKSDSANQKRSYLQIEFDTLYVVDKLELSMNGAPYFLRKAFLNEEKEWKNKKGKTSRYNQVLKSFDIQSGKPTVIYLNGHKVNRLLVEIHNGDNPSLDVVSVKTYQLNRYLTAWLNKETTYTVKFGNVELSEPAYDLAFFKEKIPADIPLLQMGPIHIVKKETAAESPAFFTNKKIIWIAIILVIIILGLMSVRMIRETSKS